MINTVKYRCSSSKINKTQIKNLADFGLFSLGLSYLLYFFLQYFFAPLCWWLAQNIESLEWMNDVFVLFENQRLEVFTIQSLYYSLLGIVAFISGYYFLSAKLVRIKHGLILRKWNPIRAEKIFWLLFFSGFALKTIKVIAGVSIADTVSDHIKHGLISNPLISFYFSFNWFNLIALIVINVVYQEAKREKHFTENRLKLISYSYNIFYLLATFTTGGKTATLFPLIGLLIIKQYYSVTPISALKMLLPLSILMTIILIIKNLMSEYFDAEGYDPGENSGVAFELFYVFFHRINMSQVISAVIEKGQLSYPDGTFGQFLVDMTLYGFEKKNVFDGNEFGQLVGIASPGDNVTGFASTNMGELFINFDLFGIVLGMLITGILYKIIFANCQQRSPMFVMLYALMWPILIHGMESPVSVLYATSIKMISLCLIVHIAIAFKLSRGSSQKIIFSKDIRDVAT
jgi:oligosaccharide repeat unit polymerase